MIVCDVIVDIEKFQDLVDLDDNTPIVECVKPFGNQPTVPIEELTKDEFIEQFFDKIIFSLVNGSNLVRSIEELKLYFQYMNALYEEK